MVRLGLSILHNSYVCVCYGQKCITKLIIIFEINNTLWEYCEFYCVWLPRACFVGVKLFLWWPALPWWRQPIKKQRDNRYHRDNNEVSADGKLIWVTMLSVVRDNRIGPHMNSSWPLGTHKKTYRGFVALSYLFRTFAADMRSIAATHRVGEESPSNIEHRAS